MQSQFWWNDTERKTIGMVTATLIRKLIKQDESFQIFLIFILPPQKS